MARNDEDKLTTMYYDVARKLEEMAQAEMKKDYPSSDQVHWLVSERRRMERMPRVLEIRFGKAF